MTGNFSSNGQFSFISIEIFAIFFLHHLNIGIKILSTSLSSFKTYRGATMKLA